LEIRQVKPNGGKCYNGYNVSDHGERDKTGKYSIGTCNFSSTSRPWYSEAIQAGKGTWSTPYFDAISMKLGITFAVPVYCPNGDVVGVVGMDTFLGELTRLVTTAKSTSFFASKGSYLSIHIFLVHKNGIMVPPLPISLYIRIQTPKIHRLHSHLLLFTLPQLASSESEIMDFVRRNGAVAATGIPNSQVGGRSCSGSM
jgi:hypothetical protein